MELMQYIKKLESDLNNIKSMIEADKQEVVIEEIEVEEKKEEKTSGRGRRKGSKDTRERWQLHMYDITDPNNFKYIETFNTFYDMSDFLKSRNLNISHSILKNIYNGKTNNEFIKITHV